MTSQATRSEGRQITQPEPTYISRAIDSTSVALAVFYTVEAVLSYLSKDYQKTAFFGVGVPVIIAGRFCSSQHGYLQRIIALANSSILRARDTTEELQEGRRVLTGEVRTLQENISSLRQKLEESSGYITEVLERGEATDAFRHRLTVAVDGLQVSIDNLVQKNLADQVEIARLQALLER
ncbi:MAG: hypothetical protein FJZ58_06255 [Chlamydiae bacterium]|nr:hypothetical protein [Chlamydiota bacterium]